MKSSSNPKSNTLVVAGAAVLGLAAVGTAVAVAAKSNPTIKAGLDTTRNWFSQQMGMAGAAMTAFSTRLNGGRPSLREAA